ncbi:MAG: mechanosensitive ion channel family protein [Bacteroidia bacterium]
MDFTKKFTELSDAAINHLPQLFLALLTLFIGLWIIRMVLGAVNKLMRSREFEPTVQRFLVSLLDVILKMMLILSVASMLGIQTTSFLAILTSASLAIGLALQGGLANFAGGVLLLIFKPFKVGDLIDAQGFFGEVQEISIFVTKILTPDNKTVIIPNGPLANGNICNVSEKGNLRIDLKVCVPNGTDIEKARTVILDALKNTPHVLAEPAPSVNVLELNNGFITLAFRPYSTPAAYWDAYFLSNENVRKALDNAGINSPIPVEIRINQQ